MSPTTGRASTRAASSTSSRPTTRSPSRRAIQIKEASGGNRHGRLPRPAEATKEIRQALAMGADKAIHIKDARGQPRPAGHREGARRHAQGPRRSTRSFFGKQSIDSDNSAVGVMVARLLDLPVRLAGDEARDRRRQGDRASRGGGRHRGRRGRSCPRSSPRSAGSPSRAIPSIKGIMMAKKKPIEEIDAPEPSGTS